MGIRDIKIREHIRDMLLRDLCLHASSYKNIIYRYLMGSWSTYILPWWYIKHFFNLLTLRTHITDTLWGLRISEKRFIESIPRFSIYGMFKRIVITIFKWISKYWIFDNIMFLEEDMIYENSKNWRKCSKSV